MELVSGRFHAASLWTEGGVFRVDYDIKHLRYMQYDYTPRGMIEFENKLEEYIAIASAENITEEKRY